MSVVILQQPPRPSLVLLVMLALAGQPLIALMPGAATAVVEPQPGDFFAGYQLQLDGEGPFYRLQLPEEVYAASRRADLSDIRVFNRGGEVMAQALRRSQEPPAAKGEPREVPFFPLHREEGRPAGGSLALAVVRDDSGAILTLREEGSGERRLYGYLLDLGERRRLPGRLELHWQALSPSSLYTLHIEQSDDLQHWRTLVTAAPLADLSHHGQRVEKRHVALPWSVGRYLRLGWKESEPLRLTGVSLVAESGHGAAGWVWSDLGGGEVVRKEGRLEVHYRGDFRLPVGGARLVFARPNSLARVVLQSRDDDNTPWRSRCSQSFYVLDMGGVEVQDDGCSFVSTGDTRWRLLVEEDGAGIAGSGGAPGLQLGRLAGELLFIARGAPPFTLAFASERLPAGDGGSGQKAVLEALDLAASPEKVATARPLRRVELGGEEALRPPAAPLAWKKWILWTVLFAGVTALAVMARRLLREMNGGGQKS